jgi:hypothetical protein
MLRRSPRKRDSLPLSPTAAASQYKHDFEAAISTNARPGVYGHHSNWKGISEQYHQKIAQARLIKDKYGVPSPVACDRCVKKGSECRIYDPELQASRGEKPGSCGECRIGRATCTIGGFRQRSRLKKSATVSKRPAIIPKTRVKVSRKPAQKVTKSTEAGIYCPVKDCPRHWEGFSCERNMKLHVQNMHPENRIVPTPRARKASGTFVCPVPNCASASDGRYARLDHLCRHIRRGHPTTIHAQVLEAVANKMRIVLPPPPSRSEFTTDFGAATTTNASPGVIGYRLSTDWTRAHPQIKSRIAHAKMIHGKYGVIAPESCPGCKKRGTTCMVYHPGLKDVGRALNKSCGECRDRSVKCEISSQSFAEILDGVEQEKCSSPADKEKDIYTDLDMDANSGNQSLQDEQLDPQLHSHYHNLQTDYMLDNEAPETRTRIEHGQEDSTPGGIGDQTSSGGEEHGMDPHSRPITSEDLAAVVVASDGALQIAYDTGNAHAHKDMDGSLEDGVGSSGAEVDGRQTMTSGGSFHDAYHSYLWHLNLGLVEPRVSA